MKADPAENVKTQGILSDLLSLKMGPLSSKRTENVNNLYGLCVQVTPLIVLLWIGGLCDVI